MGGWNIVEDAASNVGMDALLINIKNLFKTWMENLKYEYY